MKSPFFGPAGIGGTAGSETQRARPKRRFGELRGR